MLERASVGQSRFNVPGVSTDSRGVCLGRSLALLFASIDRVVAFFSAFSAENSMADLLSGLQIRQVETPLRTRELIVVLPARSSHIADMAARLTRVVGGTAFTGTSKHFVLYRDDRSPLGYDTSELVREDCDFALYGWGFSQTYRVSQDLDFATLVKRLSVIAERPRRGRDEDQDAGPAGHETLLLRAEPGLAGPVRGYLWRSGVRAAMAIVSRAISSAFTDTASEYYLFRMFDTPPRVLRLFRRMPGVKIYLPYADTFAVEIGYRHPLNLENCTGIFAADRLALFDGSDGLEETTSAPQFVPIEKLGSASFEVAASEPRRSRPRTPTAAEAAARFALQIRLVPAGAGPRRVRATLVPRDQRMWLRKVVYTLPSALLRRYRVADIGEFVVLLSSEGVDSMPLGIFMEAFAPNIFIPMGYRFVPAISPEVLTRHLQAKSENNYFFVGGRTEPFFIPADRFETLERRALAPLQAHELAVAPVAAAAAAPNLVNLPVGQFSLWFHRVGEAPPALADDTIGDTIEDR